jgi:hypothetical protein
MIFLLFHPIYVLYFGKYLDFKIFIQSKLGSFGGVGEYAKNIRKK